MKKNTRLALYLCSALALLVSCLGASLVQTGAGSTQVQELTIASPSGRTMSALLLRPSGATPATPAPTIALSHGTWNNKEMQDANYVELARRGTSRYPSISILTAIPRISREQNSPTCGL